MGVKLRCFAMVEIEQAAQPFRFDNFPGLRPGSRIRKWDYIVETLMISFVMVVGKILGERVAQGAHAKQNQLNQDILI